MPRNKKDFESCPECYGRGYIGYPDDEGGGDTEDCPTCNKDGVVTKRMQELRDRDEDAANARADEERGK